MRDEYKQGVTNVGVTNSFEKRKVQTQGRIDIPDEWLEDMGLEEGDHVFVKYDGDNDVVKLFEADVDMIEP